MPPTRHCPSCRQGLLDPIESEGCRSELCVRCRGLWFEAGDLASAIQDYDPAAMSANKIAQATRERRGLSQDACPNCKTTLIVHDLSEINPTHVETCPDCSGVWLPHGSLDHALAGHHLSAAQESVDGEPTWRDWFTQLLTGLPIEFNVAPHKTPFVTYGLIAANVVIHLLVTAAFVSTEANFDAYALNPAQMPAAGWWSGLLTSQFLHVGLIHLVGNMYFLWILGDNVEDVLGGPAFLAFYLAAGVAGGVFYSLSAGSAGTPAVGASGAISGVIALYAMLFRKSSLTFMALVWQFKISTPIYVGFWLAFNLAGWAIGGGGVAWGGHLGGFFLGLLVGGLGHTLLLRRRPLLRLLNQGAQHPRP
ncbi:MAG: rhomboid family intramembrane serine protease [Myxococcota bacterium]